MEDKGLSNIIRGLSCVSIEWSELVKENEV